MRIHSEDNHHIKARGVVQIIGFKKTHTRDEGDISQ